jgi:hypothetical protein
MQDCRQVPKSNNIRPFLETLGVKERRFLRDGELPPDKTRSDLIQSVANSAANHGRTKDEFFEAMLDASNKGTRKVFEILETKGSKAAEAWLDRTWKSAIKFIEQHPSNSNRDYLRQQIQLMSTTIQSMPWTGRYGPIDLAILTFHLNLAEQLGSLSYTASIRRIAFEAGFNAPTVMRAHRRLSAFVSRDGCNSSRTTRWQLKLVSHHNSIPHPDHRSHDQEGEKERCENCAHSSMLGQP